MSIFEKARQRCGVISAIVKFQNGRLYPFLFAALCAFSACHDKRVYLPCMFILVALSVFAGLFSPDLKVFIVPAFTIFYSMGADIPSDYYDKFYEKYLPVQAETWRMTLPFDRSSLLPMVLCVVLLALVLFYRLIQSGILRDMLKLRGKLAASILILDAAFLTNGLFSQRWRVESLLYGVLFAVTVTVFYFAMREIIRRGEDGIAYACRTLVATGLCVCAQLGVIAYRLSEKGLLLLDFGESSKRIAREFLSTAWGVVTITGAVLVICLIAAFYLARDEKFPVFYIGCAFLFLLCCVFINARWAMLVGGILFIVGCVFCCANGKNKKTNRIVTLFLVLLAVAIAVSFFLLDAERRGKLFSDLAQVMRFNFNTAENGFWQGVLGIRYDIFALGLQDFASAPLFGAGFLSGDYPANLVYDKMYHNIIIEFLGSMGAVGILAFIYHVFVILKRTKSCRNDARAFLVLFPFAVIVLSLLDNFFFYPIFNIYYATFLACVELASVERDGKRDADIQDQKNKKI